MAGVVGMHGIRVFPPAFVCMHALSFFLSLARGTPRTGDGLKGNNSSQPNTTAPHVLSFGGGEGRFCVPEVKSSPTLDSFPAGRIKKVLIT